MNTNSSLNAGGGTPAVQNASIIIFGATGDLTARKLIPALFRLWDEGFLPKGTPIIGLGRREKADDEFRNELREAVADDSRRRTISDEHWNGFARSLYYRQIDITDTAEASKLANDVKAIESEAGVSGNRVAYMATAPDLFLPGVEILHAAGLVPDRESEHWLRVVFEKPFGHDLESAQELNKGLARILLESQIYRIDHYLGKETVQNILLFRFGNAVFEPLLNRNHVDHVQITVAESQGMEHGRGGYYDGAGALRDVLQNHVLQLLCLVGMEPPALFRSDEIRDEKKKVLQALAPGGTKIPDWVVAGQYTSAEIQGKQVAGYREESRVAPDSRREAYVAMQVNIDNWRWAGVPFYLRTGKRLPERITEIAIQFQLPPLNLFTTVECEGDMCDLVGARPNSLIFRIQPNESISLNFSTKRPGMQYQIHPASMKFNYDSIFGHELPEAYERLLLDVLRGDSTLFMRSDELEAAWSFVTPVLKYWEESQATPEQYRAGTWGPAAANQLLSRTGRHWRKPTVGTTPEV